MSTEDGEIEARTAQAMENQDNRNGSASAESVAVNDPRTRPQPEPLEVVICPTGNVVLVCGASHPGTKT